jgi:hypothetical protein
MEPSKGQLGTCDAGYGRHILPHVFGVDCNSWQPLPADPEVPTPPNCHRCGKPCVQGKFGSWMCDCSSTPFDSRMASAPPESQLRHADNCDCISCRFGDNGFDDPDTRVPVQPPDCPFCGGSGKWESLAGASPSLEPPSAELQVLRLLVDRCRFYECDPEIFGTILDQADKLLINVPSRLRSGSSPEGAQPTPSNACKHGIIFNSGIRCMTCEAEAQRGMSDSRIQEKEAPPLGQGEK